MATRRRLTHEARHVQLLDVAEALFAERGFDATTMDDIAREAGVTRAVVYTHFSNRDVVLMEGVRRAHEELDRRLSALASETTSVTDPAELVERGGELFFQMLESVPDRWSLLFAPSAASTTAAFEELQAMRRATIGGIADVGLKLQPDVSPARADAVASMISGLGEQLGRWWLRQEDVPRAQVVTFYRDFILRGITDLVPAARGHVEPAGHD